MIDQLFCYFFIEVSGVNLQKETEEFNKTVLYLKEQS